MESAKKLVEVLGKKRTQSLIMQLEKMKNPTYLKYYMNKSSEAHRINAFLERFNEYLLFTEDYISVQLNLIAKEHDEFRSTKEEPNLLLLKDLEYYVQKNKLQDDFPKILRTSLVIALCSYIEDVVKNKGIENHKSNLKFKQLAGKGVFESSKEILRDTMGIENIEELNWDYFIDLFKIRNDLAHNGGKINQSKNVDLTIYKISIDENDYLVLSKESLESIFQESKEFIKKFSYLVIMDL